MNIFKGIGIVTDGAVDIVAVGVQASVTTLKVVNDVAIIGRVSTVKLRNEVLSEAVDDLAKSTGITKDKARKQMEELLAS
jgi:hypothetical protein